MRHLHLLSALLLAVASAAAQDCPPDETPKLEVDLSIEDFYKQAADSSRGPYLNFKGLLVEELFVREIHPLPLYVYFDSGSAKLPVRYRRLARPELTLTFDEETVSGGTIQKYWHVLNVVGSRMRLFPKTRIQIVGCNSQQPQIGETVDVSRRRGETLYRYLIDIWDIDSTRIKLLKPRGFPEARSNPKDPMGITENRRAEIHSTDWEIIRPVVQSELRRYPQPAAVGFRIDNGRRGTMRRWIEVRRAGQPWARFDPDDPLNEGPDREYNWGKDCHPDSLPYDEASYSFRLVVADTTGRECRSQEVSAPVVIIDEERKIREALIDYTMDRFLLIQFPFDSPGISRYHDRAIREYIVPRIRSNAQITVVSYNFSDVGEEALSRRRQESVAKRIQALAPQGSDVAMVRETRTGPLFAEPLPESAFYSRAIQVIVVNPVR